MIIYNMATTDRHNRVVGGFSHELAYRYRNLIRSESMLELREEIALVYLGEYGSCSKLIDCTLFDESVDYNIVQPDYMLFYKNTFRKNFKGTRFAGSPDLIIEVWSDINYKEERDWKKKLYSTGVNTEHWYLTQDSNIVECYYECNQLPNQSLSNVLKTTQGLEFDLTYLQL